MVEAAPVALLVCDRRGAIRLANHEATELFGYSRGELLGADVDMLVPDAARTGHDALRKAFFARPSARRMGAGRELEARRRDGTRVPVEIALTPLGVGEEALVLVAVLDVSERRRLQQHYDADLRRSHEQLEQRVHERTAQLEQANQQNERLLADLRAQRSELERLSREDALTGLPNRREFDRRLDDEIRRAQRLHTPLSVAILDLDRFKLVNDRYGHAVGDAVLREVGVLLRTHCRAIDISSRYGGEEFALAFPDTDVEEAAHVCERIRTAFEQHDWTKLGADLSVTVSAGVASWHPGVEVRALLAHADARLYAGKAGGRNRVVAADA